MSRVYPAKVLLYGEHTVLRGGRGLAVPYPTFHLRWDTGTPDPRLLEFAEYLAAHPEFHLDTDRLHEDLRRGARLAGNIPTGYGLGSSGAVCAAVYDRYALTTLSETGSLRTLLAAMEGHFHGNSSGTDPLIAYLQRPLVLGGGADAGVVRFSPGNGLAFFLVDTGMERSASSLIHRFLDAYDREPEPIQRGWQQPADEAIGALLAGNAEALYAATAVVSEFQLKHFPTFIPHAYHGLWNGGDAYRLKLCGAGGGGMLLGLARDRRTVEERFAGVRWLSSV